MSVEEVVTQALTGLREYRDMLDRAIGVLAGENTQATKQRSEQRVVAHHPTDRRNYAPRGEATAAILGVFGQSRSPLQAAEVLAGMRNGKNSRFRSIQPGNVYVQIARLVKRGTLKVARERGDGLPMLYTVAGKVASK